MEWWPLMHPPTGDLAHNPGMCPDWESNQLPFGSQACAQSTELHLAFHFLALNMSISLGCYKLVVHSTF